MSEALKHQISLSVVRKIEQRLLQVYGLSDWQPANESFVFLPLMRRVHLLAEYFALQLAQRMELKLRAGYAEVVSQLPKVAHGLPDMAQFIFPQMIVIWGLKRPEVLSESLQGLQALTELYTSELAMRQFIVEYGQRDDRVWQQLIQWTQSQNPHHRRLASESTRPRLPWAPHLSLTKAYPEKSLEILQPLWEDPHPYVRKSVANHLNDHLKFNRDWAYQILKNWAKNPSPATQKIVKHALRNELKAGVLEAYQILNYPSAEQFKLNIVFATLYVDEQGWLRYMISGGVKALKDGGGQATKVRLDLYWQYQSPNTKTIKRIKRKLLDKTVKHRVRVPFYKSGRLEKIGLVNIETWHQLVSVEVVKLQLNGKTLRLMRR